MLTVLHFKLEWSELVVLLQDSESSRSMKNGSLASRRPESVAVVVAQSAPFPKLMPAEPSAIESKKQKEERHRLAIERRAVEREKEREIERVRQQEELEKSATMASENKLAEDLKPVKPVVYVHKTDYPDWIWDLLHANHLNYSTIVGGFIHLSNGGFQQFEDEMDLSAAAASIEQRGHNIIFSLRSPIDGKLYSEGAHVLHGGALRKAWPSWRFAMIRLLERASIIPAKR